METGSGFWLVWVCALSCSSALLSASVLHCVSLPQRLRAPPVLRISAQCFWTFTSCLWSTSRMDCTFICILYGLHLDLHFLFPMVNKLTKPLNGVYLNCRVCVCLLDTSAYQMQVLHKQLGIKVINVLSDIFS